MYKQSAIHYMGNKFTLLPQILPYFPRNIKTFYDLFGGSATVSLNVKAEKYILNDLNNHIYNLYEMFKNTSAADIISYCETNRDKYGFSIDVRDKPKIAELNHKPYYKCREDMNNNPSALGFYFLTFYSFCNQFRFNKGKFNMAVGNGYFKEESKIFIKDFCNFMNRGNVYIYHKSYEEFTEFDEDCFCYFDIPYSNTNCCYTESSRDQGNWTEESDYAFFRYCEDLNSKGIRFAISNVFKNKGAENNHLKEWCEKNNWIVHHLNMKYAGHSFESANMETDEVLICNYKTEDSIFLF